MATALATALVATLPFSNGLARPSLTDIMSNKTRDVLAELETADESLRRAHDRVWNVDLGNIQGQNNDTVPELEAQIASDTEQVALFSSVLLNLTHQHELAIHALDAARRPVYTSKSGGHMLQRALAYATSRAESFGNSSSLLASLRGKIVPEIPSLSATLEELQEMIDDRVQIETGYIGNLEESSQTLGEPVTHLNTSVSVASLEVTETQLHAQIRNTQMALVQARARISLCESEIRRLRVFSDRKAASRSASLEAQSVTGDAYNHISTDLENVARLVHESAPTTTVQSKSAAAATHVNLAKREDSVDSSSVDDAPEEAPIDGGVTASEGANETFPEPEPEPEYICPYALRMDGVNDGGVMSGPVQLQADAPAIALAVWIRAPAAGSTSATLLALDALAISSPPLSILIVNDTALAIRVGDGAGVPQVMPTPFRDDTWHHLIIVWGGVGGEVTFYVDGKFRSRHWGVSHSSMSRESSITLGNDGKHMPVGQRNGGFVGEMRDAFVFFGDLMPSEVGSLYHNGVYEGRVPVVHWPLSQLEGSQVVDVGSIHANGRALGGAWVRVIEVEDRSNSMPQLDIVCSEGPQSVPVWNAGQGPQGIPVRLSEAPQAGLTSTGMPSTNPFAPAAK